MLIKFELTDQGNKYVISKSKTKNNIAIKKNLTEKGSPGEWNGLNPHSYTVTFSLSGVLLDNKTDNIDKIPQIIKLIQIKIITNFNSFKAGL